MDNNIEGCIELLKEYNNKLGELFFFLWRKSNPEADRAAISSWRYTGPMMKELARHSSSVLESSPLEPWQRLEIKLRLSELEASIFWWDKICNSFEGSQ